MRFLTLAFCMLIFVALTAPGSSQKSNGEMQAVRQFAQRFYDWYVPMATKEATKDQPPTDVLAIRRQPSAFTANLVRALEADWAAQSKVTGEIVGLDFDPFLASQDPEVHYEVGKVTRSGKVFLAEIHHLESGKVAEKADVIAEVIKVGGKYQFSNFRYPDNGGNLLTLLKQQAADRRRGGQ